MRLTRPLLLAIPAAAAAYDAANLFPIPVQAAWTTSQTASGLPSSVNKVALTDAALNLTKNAGGQPHDLVDAPGAGPAGKAWRAFYPKGSYNPSGEPEGGFGLYLAGPGDVWQDADNILFSYAVFFPDKFDFVCVLPIVVVV